MREICKGLLHPTMEWGPALPEHRIRYSVTSQRYSIHPIVDDRIPSIIPKRAEETAAEQPLAEGAAVDIEPAGSSNPGGTGGQRSVFFADELPHMVRPLPVVIEEK